MMNIGIRSKLVLITITAIILAGSISGYLNLKDIESVFESKEQMNEIMLRTVFFAVPFLFILVFSIMILTNISILVPIRKLIDGLRKIGRGEDVASIDVKSKDEIGELAQSFNTMANNLQKVSTSRDVLNLEVIERQKIEEELRSSEERYRLLAENIRDVIWTLDMDYKFNYISPAVKDIFGYTPEETLKLDYSALMPKESYEEFSEFIKQNLDEKQFRTFRFIKKNGKTFWGEVSVSYLCDENKTRIGLVGLIRDINERKETEDRLDVTFQDLAHNERIVRVIAADLQKKNAELIEAQKQLIQSGKMVAVGQLAVGIAHEIKNPLGIIQLGVETLEKSKDMIDGKNKEHLSMVKRAIERADKIIVQLLNFSRYSEKDFQEVKLDNVLDGAVNLILNRAKLKNVDVIKKYEDNDSLLVLADQIMLEQVFFNILGNALDSMSMKGSIFIRRIDRETTDGLGREFVIEIEDTGEGMPEDVASRIFDPFFTTKGPGKGTGLGLSTSFMILEKHQGKVSVESKLGKGTKFIISLPSSADFENEAEVSK